MTLWTPSCGVLLKLYENWEVISEANWEQELLSPGPPIGHSNLASDPQNQNRKWLDTDFPKAKDWCLHLRPWRPADGHWIEHCAGWTSGLSAYEPHRLLFWVVLPSPWLDFLAAQENSCRLKGWTVATKAPHMYFFKKLGERWRGLSILWLVYCYAISRLHNITRTCLIRQ